MSFTQTLTWRLLHAGVGGLDEVLHRRITRKHLGLGLGQSAALQVVTAAEGHENVSVSSFLRWRDRRRHEVRPYIDWDHPSIKLWTQFFSDTLTGWVWMEQSIVSLCPLCMDFNWILCPSAGHKHSTKSKTPARKLQTAGSDSEVREETRTTRQHGVLPGTRHIDQLAA